MNTSESIHAIVTAWTLGEAAFAMAQNGDGDIYIPSSISGRMKLQNGDTILAKVKPNTLGRGTRWFCIHATKTGDIADDERVSDVEHVLDSGGAWTPQEMADEIGCDPATAFSIMDRFYSSGRGVKFCRYSGPGSGPDLHSFSWVPDRVVIDEFEEEDA